MEDFQPLSKLNTEFVDFAESGFVGCTVAVPLLLSSSNTSNGFGGACFFGTVLTAGVFESCWSNTDSSKMGSGTEAFD